jgi:hypothetical protein
MHALRQLWEAHDEKAAQTESGYRTEGRWAAVEGERARAMCLWEERGGGGGGGGGGGVTYREIKDSVRRTFASLSGRGKTCGNVA